MALVRKQFPLTIKAIEDDANGVPSGFRGDASVYHVVDLHGDIIEPGAFDATLRSKGRERPLLWQHYIDQPIGTAAFEDDPGRALETEGSPVTEVRQAAEAMALLKAGAVKGLSIGFDIVREAWDGAVRRIEEIDLWEVSLVTFPANPLAQVTEAKSAGEALAELQAKRTVAVGAEALRKGAPLTAEQRKTLAEAAELLHALAAQAPADDEGSDAGEGPVGDTLAGTDEPEGPSPLEGLLAEIRSHRRS